MILAAVSTRPNEAPAHRLGPGTETVVARIRRSDAVAGPCAARISGERQ